MAKVLKFKGIVFDDITDQDNGLKMWSQICKCCTEKHNIDTKYLEEDAGNGICGVEGCENEADHYIDFEDDEVEITDNENCHTDVRKRSNAGREFLT